MSNHGFPDDVLIIEDPKTGVQRYKVSDQGVVDLSINRIHTYVPNPKLPRICQLWLNDICMCCGKTRLQVARGK